MICASAVIVGGVELLRTRRRRADLSLMAAAPIYYTADMVRALPEDGNRYETVYGELLVTPSPRQLHQIVHQRLSLELGNYLVQHPVAVLLYSPSDISWGPDILVQPDIFVADLGEMRREGGWEQLQTLHLVIEVLSPATSRFDRFTKRRLYQNVGIPLYWIVDCDVRQMEIWTPGDRLPVMERERLEWTAPGASEPCAIDVPHLFRPL